MRKPMFKGWKDKGNKSAPKIPKGNKEPSLIAFYFSYSARASLPERILFPSGSIKPPHRVSLAFV